MVSRRCAWWAGLVFAAGCQAAPAGGAVVPAQAAVVPVSGARGEGEAVPVAEAGAGSRPVLVELYSSQGCNSCPAADAVLGRLPALGFAAEDVVALTFHVTYWDYLGWRDPFGSAKHDARQLEYVDAELPGHDGRAAQGPYTPQMIVDGRVHFPGSNVQATRQRLAEARARPAWLGLGGCSRRSSDSLQVDIASRVSAPRPNGERIGVFAALAQRVVETAVPRGENAGQRLTEYAVVRDLAGPVDRRDSLQLELRAPAGVEAGALEVVVFAQDLATRAIVGVTRAPACAE